MSARPAQEYYEQAAARPLLLMRVCSYLRHGEECEGCRENDQHSQYGYGTKMCWLMAQEVTAVILEAAAAGPEVITQDN